MGKGTALNSGGICQTQSRPTPPTSAAMADNVELDVDAVIEKLLEVRGQRPGKQVQLAEEEIRALCIKSREVFLSQPILLELQVRAERVKMW